MVRFGISAFVLTIYILLQGTVEAKLKRGRYPQFNDFCTEKDVYVGVPWDCSGYIQCQQGNGIKMTFWLECAANLYFSLKHKTCMWPEDVENPCPRVRGMYHIYKATLSIYHRILFCHSRI